MSRLHRTPPLLAIPLEIREQIYLSVFSQRSQGTQLLRTCREIYMEAEKFLFQRPLRFRHQSALYEWLSQTPENLLRYVKEISLEIQDIDLRPLLTQTAPNSQDSQSPRLLSWELYENELERLKEALQKLPNVKSLTLRALSGRQSFLYREYLTKVLGMLGFLYPNLCDLGLEGNMHHQSLVFLSTLQQLKSLSFDGFSSSSPTETGDIMSGLTHLTELCLFSQDVLLTPTHYQHSSFTSKPQCLTGDVIRTFNQLASFSVTEHTPSCPPTLFFTSEILASLHTHKTLKSLSISLSHTPDTETLESLEDFMGKSLIERLELDWPGLDPQVLETYSLLPDCLRDFWVRTTSMMAAFDILWPVLESREAGDTQELRRVVLVRQGWDSRHAAAPVSTQRSSEHMRSDQDDDPDHNDSDEANVALAKRRLNALSVQVSWCTETS